MGEFCLTAAEVAELTGAERVKGQLDFFAREGIPAIVGKDGRVKVLRAAVEAKMMPNNKRTRARTAPGLALKIPGFAKNSRRNLSDRQPLGVEPWQ